MLIPVPTRYRPFSARFGHGVPGNSFKSGLPFRYNRASTCYAPPLREPRTVVDPRHCLPRDGREHVGSAVFGLRDIGKPEGYTHSISGTARQDGEISPCNGSCSCCCIPLPTILQRCIVLSVNQWRLPIAEPSLVIGSIEIPHHPPRS